MNRYAYSVFNDDTQSTSFCFDREAARKAKRTLEEKDKGTKFQIRRAPLSSIPNEAWTHVR